MLQHELEYDNGLDAEDAAELEQVVQVHQVLVPPVGNFIAWNGPSLFNNDSLHSVLFSDDGKSNTTALLPTIKRPHLPLLQVTASATNPPRQLCGPPPGRTLRLDILLGQGYEILSQTWKATALPDNLPVCVKLFTDQEDKMPSDTYIPQEEYEEVDWSKDNGGDHAQRALCREADRYRALANFQGECVSYSYGLYEFELPSQVTVVGHVMEFVESCDIPHCFEQIKSNEALVDNFLQSLLNAVIQLHACDVVHRDLYLCNILLYWSKQREFNFVIVDFGLACSIRYYKTIRETWCFAEKTFLQNMLEDELDFDTICDWMETENGKRLWDLVQKDPDELAALRASGNLEDRFDCCVAASV